MDDHDLLIRIDERTKALEDHFEEIMSGMHDGCMERNKRLTAVEKAVYSIRAHAAALGVVGGVLVALAGLLIKFLR